jgi:two-component system, chemotaxis family, protein-glutamate methylesterase/glutaminase
MNSTFDSSPSLSLPLEVKPTRRAINMAERPTGHNFDVVAIGASAGGVEAISNLIELLPSQLAACILIVLHQTPERASHLHHILSRKTDLRIIVAHGGEQLKPGVCLTGPIDRHLTLGPDNRVHLLPNTFYRAHNIDALFCSLARHAGRRAIGVVLSGVLKDGSLGLRAIKEAGGVALVRTPDEAEYPDMPKSAIEFDGKIDLIGPIRALAGKISALVGERRDEVA